MSRHGLADFERRVTGPLLYNSSRVVPFVNGLGTESTF